MAVPKVRGSSIPRTLKGSAKHHRRIASVVEVDPLLFGCRVYDPGQTNPNIPIASTLGPRLHYSNDHWGNVKHHQQISLQSLLLAQVYDLGKQTLTEQKLMELGELFLVAMG